MIDIKFDQNKVTHSGIFESPCFANGKIEGKFYIGAYSYISSTSKIFNTFVGNFSRIEDGCDIGFNLSKKDNLSNHYFSFSDNGPFRDNLYYQSIKSERYYYEREKLTFIGNDVHLHKNVHVYSGCTIGDGAVVLANSVVIDDIPPFTIAAGNPAKVIDERFSTTEIKSLISNSEWWHKDISSIMDDKKRNITGNISFLSELEKDFPLLQKNRVYFNGISKQITEMPFVRCIAGPSHIHIWQKAVFDGKLKPENYFLLGIPGISSYSNNFTKAIVWLSTRFEEVYFFVPDFRIGNSGLTSSGDFDGIFIDPVIINKEIDTLSFKSGMSKLKELSKLKNIKFLFWCLTGRETINKENGKFTNNGIYRHPIWNLSEMKEEFPNSFVDLNSIGINIIEDTLKDGTIHPNELGLKKLDAIFNSQELGNDK